MLFIMRHIEQLLATHPEQLDSDLAELIPRLVANRREHRHFGPFWWWVKEIARKMPGSRRSWLRGSYRDHRAVDLWSRTIDGVTPPGQSSENDRRLAWYGLVYYRQETLDDEPAGFHLSDVPAEAALADRSEAAAAVYHLYDADASEQMDLFGGANTDRDAATTVFRDPAAFSASLWLRRAEEEIAQGALLRASAALRRAISRAVDQTDRSRAWLRLGEILQGAGAIHPAILCYRNAFARDQEAWVHGLMGSAWLEAGDAAEAARCYRAARAAMPGNPEYEAGLARAEALLSQNGRNAGSYVLAGERLAR